MAGGGSLDPNNQHTGYGGRTNIPIWISAGYDEAEWRALSPEQRAAETERTTNLLRSRNQSGFHSRGTGFEDLYRHLPSEDDLAVQYGEDEFFGGPERSEAANAFADAGSIDAQRDALRAMQEVYQQGGMTAADRARQQLARQQTGMAMRGTREADAAQMQARGMGGSGAEVASMLGAQQGGANSLATQDAQMLIEAQQRALQAMQSSGQLGSQMRGQSYSEAHGRGSAADAFNQWQTNAQRENNRFNTTQRDRSAESRAGASQQSFQNKSALAAGMGGHFTATTNLNANAQDRAWGQMMAGVNAVGGAAGTIAGAG